MAGWRAVIFAPVGDGQRRRRGSDGVRLACAVLALICCLLIIRYNSRIDRAIIEVIHPPPRSITWLVTVVYEVGSYGVIAALVLLALLARRWPMARDLALSAAAAALTSGLLVLLLGGQGGRPTGIKLDSYDLSFPVLQIAFFMAVATVALPYLARGLQLVIETFIGLVTLAGAVGGDGLPLNVLGSMAVGWAAALLIRLILGSPLGLPSAADVGRLLGDLGICAGDVRPLPRQAWGVAKYQATETGPAGEPGQPLAVSVYGRDAADAKLLTKLGRFLFYRDSGSSLTLTRLQQVEHEGFLTMRAAQAGVAVPGVAEAGPAGPAGDALLVSRLPPGTPLSGTDAAQVGDAALDHLYQQLLALRRARIAHGAISGDVILVDPAGGRTVLTDFRNATANASAYQLDRDLAGAIAAAAVAAGAERAGKAAARCLDPDVLGGALQHLHQAGLDPALARSLRGRKGLLAEAGQRAAEAASIDVPRLVEPRRVSWTTLIMVAGTLIGGWALIGVLIDVAQSFDTVIGANWLWVAAVFVLAQLAFVASALEAIGSVAGVLPFGRVVAVEVANSFSALAGGTAAVFATRVRFFQRQGYDPAVALSSGAIMTSSSWIAKIVLFLVALPFAWGALDLDATPQSGDDSALVWIILAVVVAAGLVAGLALAVPRLRRWAAQRLRPRVRDIWGNLREVGRQPRKLVLLVGGSFAQELVVAMALSVSLRAFDDHLRLPILIVVISLAATIGGVSPTPGGMGVVEAGLILGLTAAGVPEADATAAVFIQRLFTSYLPPIWGWVTLVWMRRREYL